MAQLIGVARVGRDAEIRHTPSGDSVTEVSLAFNYGRKDENTGNKPTQWVKGSIWGQRGEKIAPYLMKGQMVYVVLDDAHVQTFQKQDGTHGAALAGRVATIEFAGPRPEQSQQTQQQQAPVQRPAPPPPQRQPQPAANLADMDDDIPF